MKRCLLNVIASLLAVNSLIFAANQQNPVLKHIGVDRGICVLPGDSSCELTLELVPESELLIYT